MMRRTSACSAIITASSTPSSSHMSPAFCAMFARKPSRPAGIITANVIANWIERCPVRAAAESGRYSPVSPGKSESVGIASSAGGVIQYLSVIQHYDDFTRGVLDTSNLIFYLSFIFLGLFLTVRSIESMRWRRA